jgi:tetratricopeptide (TPR) repeat protein/transglutaminase-like putative cysteine protease
VVQSNRTGEIKRLIFKGVSVRLSFGVGIAVAVAAASPAWAGEEPLYQPTPAWVRVASLPTARSSSPIVLLDDQRRIEGGRLWAYTDRAVRIDNPQVLQGAGTIQANWIPDKGDLIIHRVTIVRDGQDIDVLKQGVRFDVLRREQQLEMRSINGVLTATLAVPGLRVGDILRLSYSVTTRDKALDGKAQVAIPLPAKPIDIGFARALVSWPVGEKVTWKTGALKDLQPTVANGYDTLTIPLPLAKPADLPDDAPLRYHVLPQLLQVGNFADWRDVSRTMAPLFATKDAIAPGGPVAEQVAAIEKASARPLDRALAALRVVQDQISYLANGMNGGNYVPQTPAETWSKRYGDCKAKTLLLVAMLRQMGIQAEPFVVASKTGDALPSMLPMPADFDHIIVHAVIDGTDYWLDGTSSGASMDVIGQVPEFSYGLPLRPEGADLMALAPRPPKAFDSDLALTIDQRAGIDVLALFQAKWTLRGVSGATFRAMTTRGSKEQLDQFVDGYVSSVLGDHWVVDSSHSYDAANNVATLQVSGMLPSGWKWQQGRASEDVDLPSAGFDFRPDRSRPAWRDIPVTIPGPEADRRSLTWLLPPGKSAFSLEGKTDFDEQVANVHLARKATLAGNTLTVTDSVIWPGGELAAAQVPAAKAEAARLGSLKLTLRAPTDTERRYRFAGGGDRADLARIEQAYVKLIADKPDDIARLADRASFRTSTFDRKGALADLDAVIDKQPSANAYMQRARLRVDTGDLQGALADTDAAVQLEPGFDAASLKASVLTDLGRFAEAKDLLEQQTSSPDNMEGLALLLSDLDAMGGNKDAGLARIEQALQQRPGDPDLLNAKCYYRATWNFQLDGIAQTCTDALEHANWAPYVLDSRAMGYFRLGRYEDAVKDLDAALSANPDQTPSLYLRGIVRERMGDKGGAQDVRDALARDPSLKLFYSRFGIKAD